MTEYTKREQVGWCMYDFANSAFYTSVITLFLGPYLTVLTTNGADASGYVHPFGIPVYAKSFWSYAVSVSVVMQVIFLPMVGAVADYGRRKKEVLGATAYLGAFATLAMFFLQGSDYLLGGFLFLIANVAFGASEVIYNSFLPEIAPIRGSRYGFLQGIRVRIHRRRRAARVEPRTVFGSGKNRHNHGNGRAHQPLLGRRRGGRCSPFPRC